MARHGDPTLAQLCRPSWLEHSTVPLLIETPNDPSCALLQRFHLARQFEVYFSFSARRCQNAGERNYFAGVWADQCSRRKLKISEIETEARSNIGKGNCGIRLKAQGWK